MQKCENRCSNAAILFLWKRGRKYVFWWFLLKSGVKWFKMEHILNYSRDVYENSGRQLCSRELMKILLIIKIE